MFEEDNDEERRWKVVKLAENVANREDLQRRIEQMRGRLQKSALVQEGESRPRILRNCSKRRRGSSPRSRGTCGASTGLIFPRHSPMTRRRSRMPWPAATP